MNRLGPYSVCIYAIAAWLERNGLTVELFSRDLPDDVAGRYDHEQQKVWLASTSSAREALMTIAHEAGHWLGFLIEPKPHSFQRERQAYVYGWYVLQWFDAPIEREEWIEDCREAEARRRALWVRVPPGPWHRTAVGGGVLCRCVLPEVPR